MIAKFFMRTAAEFANCDRVPSIRTVDCRRDRSAALIALFAIVVLSLPGCGKSSTGLVPVTGRITYGGGDWPAPGIIYFQPKQTSDQRAFAGLATFDVTGKITAKTGPRDGLAPGDYSLLIECWEVPPRMSTPNSGKSWLTEQYWHGPTKDFVVTVPNTPDKPHELNIDVPRRP